MFCDEDADLQDPVAALSAYRSGKARPLAILIGPEGGFADEERSVLLKLPNVVLSPHNAAAPIECNEKMSIRAAKNMLELFDGVLDPGYVVNPETLPNRRNV